jgi:two-component system chemotaxis sensor kinase CheA
VYRLRGNLLPLVYLNRELDSGTASANVDDAAVNIVVLQADGRPFGLVVDAIRDTEEIVVKPLSKQLKGIALFAGATIMGDGKVALILDVTGIAQRSGVVAEGHERARAEAAGRHAEDSEKQALLLCGLGSNGRLAIPLSAVARLEEIPANSVEHADGREVVQYRGQIMPLIRLADVLGRSDATSESQTMQVIVYTRGDKSVGLVVDNILDIVESSLTVKSTASGRGIMGSAVVQQRVTDLLDLNAVIRSVFPTEIDQTTAA